MQEQLLDDLRELDKRLKAANKEIIDEIGDQPNPLLKPPDTTNINPNNIRRHLRNQKKNTREIDTQTSFYKPKKYSN
jgi:hypothetical protein